MKIVCFITGLGEVLVDCMNSRRVVANWCIDRKNQKTPNTSKAVHEGHDNKNNLLGGGRRHESIGLF